MRNPLLLILLFAISSCHREDPSRVTLHHGKVERVNGCHIILDAAPGQGEAPFAGVRYVCGVSEAALNDQKWWGDQPQPLAFSMHKGECLILAETFYCLDEIGVGKASFTAAYKWATKHEDRIKPIR